MMRQCHREFERDFHLPSRSGSYTRAEQFLLYVTDNRDYRNTPTRFLRAGDGVGLC